MKFQFGKYTEITDFVFNLKPELREEGYIRFFLCPYTNDFWLCRILVGYDDEYELCPDSFLLERDRIENDYKGQIPSLHKLKEIIEENDGGNWDYQSANSVDKLIDMIDGGYGILNLKEDDDN